MAGMTVILFLCIAVPMLPVLVLLPDRRSKLFLGYLLVGTAVCLIASEINAWLLRMFGGDLLYVTTNITPIAEEILKGLPVLYFGWFFSDDRDTLLSIAFATGLGFALLENLVILTQSIETVTILWAFARGLGAALMHSACTAFVGLGISLVRKRRKTFYCGTFSLVIAASIYHAIFNTLVQSHLRALAFVLSLLLYLPQVVLRMDAIRKRRAAGMSDTQSRR